MVCGSPLPIKGALKAKRLCKVFKQKMRSRMRLLCFLLGRSHTNDVEILIRNVLYQICGWLTAIPTRKKMVVDQDKLVFATHVDLSCELKPLEVSLDGRKRERGKRKLIFCNASLFSIGVWNFRTFFHRGESSYYQKHTNSLKVFDEWSHRTIISVKGAQFRTSQSDVRKMIFKFSGIFFPKKVLPF